MARSLVYTPATDPQAPPEYVIRATVDGLDRVAAEMERKWGFGRLRLLVGDDLRARFDAQRDKLDAAIASQRVRYVQVQADGMRRAWAALDAAAIQAGHAPLAPEVWECVLPESGEVVSIVRSEAEARRVGRECRVFTLAEIARLIEALGDTVRAVKRAFPGAEVTGIRNKPIDWERGDDIPF